MLVRVARQWLSALRLCGSRCTTTTNAAPVWEGRTSKNACKAWTPPADAPIPTITGLVLERAPPSALFWLLSPPSTMAQPPGRHAARASLQSGFFPMVIRVALTNTHARASLLTTAHRAERKFTEIVAFEAPGMQGRRHGQP